jgi:hypothetical protein
MLCHVCGQAAVGQCRICNLFFCSEHGQEFCVSCQGAGRALLRRRVRLVRPAPPAAAPELPASAPSPPPTSAPERRARWLLVALLLAAGLLIYLLWLAGESIR